MPREKINHAAPFDPATSSDGPAIHGESWSEPEVLLSWTRGADFGPGFVQVAIECPRAYILNLAEDLTRDPTLETIGVFSPALNRTHVNLLVRTARRGRDQAFGADE